MWLACCWLLCLGGWGVVGEGGGGEGVRGVQFGLLNDFLIIIIII